MGPETDTGAVLLAGGESRRMGTEKGWVEFQGKPMAAHVLAAIAPLQLEVLIVAHDARYSHFGHRVVADDIPGQGPVGGILTALRHSHHSRNLVLSCDVPKVDTRLLQFLIARSQRQQATFLIAQGQLQPLIGVYHKSCIPHLEACLLAGERKLRNVVAGLHPLLVDLDQEMPGYDPAWLENFNTMQDVMSAFPHHRKMHIKITYFGMLSDRLGISSETLALDGDGKNCDLRALLIAKRPILAGLAWKIAVDQSLVQGPCDVHENSEIVLLPPFAGG